MTGVSITWCEAATPGAFGFQPLFHAPTTVPHIVVVHPHQWFDQAEVCRCYLRSLVKAHVDRSVVVTLQSGGPRGAFDMGDEKERWYRCYFRTPAPGMTIKNGSGCIPLEGLDRLCQRAATIVLVGGHVAQCHQRAFSSIMSYLRNSRIGDVEVIIPFDGCYLGQEWADHWRPCGQRQLSGVLGHNSKLFEMQGAKSFTAHEVMHQTFESIPSDTSRRYHRQRPSSGPSGIAAPEVFSWNLQAIFGGYLGEAESLEIPLHLRATDRQLSFLVAPAV